MVNSTGISFSGLGSGLDTAAIVQQLVALERIPIQLIETKKNAEQDKLDEISAFSKLVKALQDKADAISTSADMLAFYAANSDKSVASITASGGAAAGAHTLEVQQLAAQDSWAFDGVTDPNTALASADGSTVEFTIGGKTYTASVDAATSSLFEIEDAIEAAAGDVLDASIVNTGTESSPNYRLVLASKEFGEDNRITNITSNVANLSINFSAPDVDGVATSEDNISVGNNAIVNVDGLTVERTTNEINDILDGVEIDLLAANVGSPISFTVSTDTGAVEKKVNAFVDAYNGVINFINKQSTYTPGDGEDDFGTSEPLFGDSILTSVRSALRRSLYDIDVATVIGDTEGYSTLGLVGVDTNDDGTLSVNSTVLTEKLEANPELFVGLFTDDDGFDNGGADPNTPDFYTDTTADSGLMATLSREIDRMFGTYDGPVDPDTGERVVLDALFDLKQETIRETIDDYDDRITEMERRLDDFEEDLVLRFARLEELMGSLNAQGAALLNALATNQ